MMRASLRAAVAVVLCASLTGCNTAAGKIAGTLAMAAAATVVKAAVSGHSRSGGDQRGKSQVPVGTGYRGEEEAQPLTTCEAKRREFLSVYGTTRRLPPQLRCTEDGDFGAGAVYGATAVAAAASTDE
ncbi:MAG: hypothetical protein QM820_02375 [Minicystis sp.]